MSIITRIQSTVASANGHILTSGSKFVPVYTAPISRDMVVVDRYQNLEYDANRHLLVVMYFADGKFIFASYKGNPFLFTPAPWHIRRSEVVSEFDADEHVNSIWHPIVKDRVARQHFMIANSDSDHPERPVAVSIASFKRRDDRDAFAEKYAQDIDLSRNLNCLNHPSYQYQPSKVDGVQRSQRFIDRNKGRRATEALAKQQVAIDAVEADKKVYHLARFRNGDWDVQKGTKAQLIRKHRLTVAELNTIMSGRMVRGWVWADLIVRNEFIKRHGGSDA